MKMRSYIWPLFVMVILLSVSCEKEESPIVLPSKSDSAYLLSVVMGENYNTQVFVNIVTGEKWTADNLCWDLQFESSDNGRLITMNGGKKIFISNSGFQNIRNLNGTMQLFRWDNASGMKDSIVLGKWYDENTLMSHDSVYVIDRGDNMKRDERFYQFQIKGCTDDEYVLRMARIDGTGMHDVHIPKDHSKLHVYFSFDHNGEVINFEPKRHDWHFCFLPYRWIYYEFKTPLLYRVCGIHINPEKIDVAIDSTMKFSDIRKSSLIGLNFRDQRDAMGYDWKIPDFTSPTGVVYKCRNYVNYLIREKTYLNRNFKLRFIGFYDPHGQKGAPQFEVEELH